MSSRKAGTGSQSPIAQLIAKGQTQKAIDLLVQTATPEQIDEAIHLSNRYYELLGKWNKGLISREEFELGRNRVVESIPNIVCSEKHLG